MNGKQYDYVIVGSSPACLLHALAQAEDGKTVAVIDNSTEIGGVWKKVYTKNGDAYELGPHLIANNPKAYAHIEQTIGCAMLPVNPTPNIVFYLPVVGYIHLNWRLRFLYFLPLFFYGLLKGRDRKWLKAVWHNKICNTIKQSLCFSNIDFRYPKGGSQTILDMLLMRLKDRDVDIILGTHIDRLDHTQAGVFLTVGETKITAGHVAITSNTCGLSIHDNVHGTMDMNHKKRVHHMVYMKLSGVKKSQVSYTQFYTSKTVVQRVQDVTPYQGKTAPGECLLVIQLRSALETSDANWIIGDLKTLKIIPHSAQILDAEFKTYTTQCLLGDDHQKLDQRLLNITCLDTNDLAVNLDQFARMY